jgi:hypothetical protein
MVGGSTQIDAFLRACLRLRHDAAADEAVRNAARDLENDDEKLQAAIANARVGPLLHRAVGEMGIVSSRVGEALRQSYHLTALRNLLLLRELATCLRELAAATVPVLVLKGAALTETVYRNVSLRPMGDVDLLVRRADLATTRRVLEGLGYALEHTETYPGALAEYENELVLWKPARFPVFVDVHWSLFDSPYYQARIAMDWFWDTARPASINGVSTLVLGPAALLIHLCGHLALHHAITGVLWWHDVAEVLHCCRDDIDWPVLLSRTQQYGLVLPVRTVLTQVAEGWGAPIPSDVLRALYAQEYSPEESRVFTRLTAAERPAGHRFWTDLTTMPGWRQRLRFARTNLFPSATYMRQRYRIRHPLLLPLYYPYRWLRGLRGLG